METLALSRLDAPTAARMLAGVERHDPLGVMTPADLAQLCERGLCFGVEARGGQAVYVLHVDHAAGLVQVLAAKGAASPDLTMTVLPVIEAQCAGLRSIAFQTARPGLVRKARRQGYRVTGWILRKDRA